MRIAALSDIHGNLQALDAVLADLNHRSVDVTVNLGDLLSGGLQPRETAERLIPLGLPTVRGNHERQLLSTSPDQMGTSDRLAYQMMLPHHVTWFESLPLTLKLAAGVTLCHGSPTDDLTYLLDTVEEAGARPATEAEVLRRLGEETGWALMLCGHTHLPRAMRLSSGTLIVNPGSVGWPAYQDDEPFPHVMEAGTPHARYATVDDETGRWEATFHRVEYDWETSAHIAENNGRPDVARALLTGRV